MKLHVQNYMHASAAPRDLITNIKFRIKKMTLLTRRFFIKRNRKEYVYGIYGVQSTKYKKLFQSKIKMGKIIAELKYIDTWIKARKQ